MSTALAARHCQPYDETKEPLKASEASRFLSQLPAEWAVDLEVTCLQRTYKFRFFREALAFVNSIGAIAIAENHHPDLKIHHERLVTVELMTHAIGGLSENDFIIAAKIDAIPQE